MPRRREPFRGLGLVSLGAALPLYALLDGAPWLALVGAALIVIGLWDWARTRRKRQRASGGTTL